jgi:serine phosphatase RsbU (regulator of sigma subunit)
VPINVALQHAHRSPTDLQRAGGDFALAHRFLDGTTTFIVMDLWAKGAEADHYVALMQSSYDAISLAVRSPARVLSRLNRIFVDELRSRADTEGSASAFVITCDAAGQLRYAAAGTDAALLFRGPDHHRHLEPTGPLLGLWERAGYYEQGFTFRLGDLLVVCTDGITEAHARGHNRSQLGTRGLSEIMRKLIRAKVLPSCEDLMEYVGTWIGGDFHDDATAVIANCNGKDGDRSA